MFGQFDLDVDTTWIRRAAASLEDAAHGFGQSNASAPQVGAEQLGQSAQAAAVAGLLNLRAEQCVDAAAQLSSIAAGLATRLRVAADAFDRADPSTGTR